MGDGAGNAPRTADRVCAPAGSAPLRCRAAIVHDWFQGMHGAERVALALLGLFENAPDVYTFSATRELLPRELNAAIKRVSRLSRVPGLRQRGQRPGRWRWLLPYMPRYFERLPLHGYELVISSSVACAIAARPPAGALHVCYCHTPMRYVWMEEAERERLSGLKAAGLRAVAGRLRARDRAAAARPDVMIANSTAVAERIALFYGREAIVVHPPVEVERFDWRAPKQPGRLLWTHRLVPYKRPLEVARAFADLPHLQLTMVGIGPLEKSLRAVLPANVELRGWLSETELAELYAGASGFIHVGEEDFGITMVEALAAGTPVLALNRGGARDIVRDGIDGVLIDDAGDPRLVREGIELLVAGTWDRDRLRARAEEFAPAVFAGRMRSILRDHGAR